MNISGIRPAVGFYDYNSIKQAEEVGVVSQEIVPNRATEVPADTATATQNAEDVAARSRQTFGAYDYAGQYEPDATYELKGADSDIRSLDVAKAVSDMQKDELIHQYQYFVGQDLGTNTPATPSIRGAEDFSL